VKVFNTTVPVMDLTFASAVIAAGQGALGAGAEVVPKGDLCDPRVLARGGGARVLGLGHRGLEVQRGLGPEAVVIKAVEVAPR
jgi:hypothetical protein